MRCLSLLSLRLVSFFGCRKNVERLLSRCWVLVVVVVVVLLMVVQRHSSCAFRWGQHIDHLLFYSSSEGRCDHPPGTLCVFSWPAACSLHMEHVVVRSVLLSFALARCSSINAHHSPSIFQAANNPWRCSEAGTLLMVCWIRDWPWVCSKIRRGASGEPPRGQQPRRCLRRASALAPRHTVRCDLEDHA